MSPPIVNMAEMAAKDAALMGMQSAGGVPALDDPDGGSFALAEMDSIWQVMTSCGAFSSAWG